MGTVLPLAVHTGVYHSHAHPFSVASKVRGAGLASAAGTISGSAASWWWGMTDRDPAVIEVTVNRSRRPRGSNGLVFVRRDLDDVDICTVRGVRVTAAPLSALHGAVALGEVGPAMLDLALQRSVSFSDLHAAYCRQIGGHRSREAHRLMTAASDKAAAQSERMLIALFTRAGVRGWTVNAELQLRTGEHVRPDFTFRCERVLVEVDGWAWHQAPDRFNRDRQRQNALVLEGWTVLRFTWFDLTQRPGAVIREILAALHSAGDHQLGTKLTRQHQ